MLDILYIYFVSRIKKKVKLFEGNSFFPFHSLCKLEQFSRCVTKILYTRYGPMSFFSNTVIHISLASSSGSAELSPLTVIFISSS